MNIKKKYQKIYKVTVVITMVSLRRNARSAPLFFFPLKNIDQIFFQLDSKILWQNERFLNCHDFFRATHNWKLNRDCNWESSELKITLSFFANRVLCSPKFSRSLFVTFISWFCGKLSNFITLNWMGFLVHRVLRKPTLKHFLKYLPCVMFITLNWMGPLWNTF